MSLAAWHRRWNSKGACIGSAAQLVRFFTIIVCVEVFRRAKQTPRRAEVANQLVSVRPRSKLCRVDSNKSWLRLQW